MNKQLYFKKMKFQSQREVYTSYGNVFKVMSYHLGLFLDMVIPFTFGLITMGFKKFYNKELFRIDTERFRK